MNTIVQILYRGMITLGLIALIVMVGFGVTGCATSDGYQRYLAAQATAIKNQKPMLEIIAEKGQPITGLSAIRVYGPGLSIQQEKDNEWARVVTSGLQVVGLVGGIVAAGNASENLVKAVGGLGISSTAIDNSSIDNHTITDSYNQTATPTVVNQPAPVIVTQPTPVVVRPEVVVTP